MLVTASLVAGLDLRLALPRLHLLVGLGQERLPTTSGGGDRGSTPPAEDEDGGDRSDDVTRDQRCRDVLGCSCLSSGAGGVPKSVEGRAASGSRDGPASHPQRCPVLVLEVAIVVVIRFIVRPVVSGKAFCAGKMSMWKGPSS